MDSSVTLVGNVTRDPELRFTPSGQGVCSFGIAVNRRWKVEGSADWSEQTSFFECVAWRELGENAAACLNKGDRVIVCGRLEQQSWEDEAGNKRSKVQVLVEDIGPSVRFALVEVRKIEHRRVAGAAV